MKHGTPRIDAWRSDVRAALSDYGKKAELARCLAAQYGGEQRYWEKRIQNTLNRQSPNGELVLAINAWLEMQRD